MTDKSVMAKSIHKVNIRFIAQKYKYFHELTYHFAFFSRFHKCFSDDIRNKGGNYAKPKEQLIIIYIYLL